MEGRKGPTRAGILSFTEQSALGIDSASCLRRSPPPPAPRWCREGRLCIKISFSTARLELARHVYYYGSPSASHCNASPPPWLFFLVRPFPLSCFEWRPGGSCVLPRLWVRCSAMVSGEGPPVGAGLLSRESRGCLCLSRGALFGPKTWASGPGVSVGEGRQQPPPQGRLGWEKGEQAALIRMKQNKCVCKVSPGPQRDSGFCKTVILLYK